MFYYACVNLDLISTRLYKVIYKNVDIILTLKMHVVTEKHATLLCLLACLRLSTIHVCMHVLILCWQGTDMERKRGSIIIKITKNISDGYIFIHLYITLHYEVQSRYSSVRLWWMVFAGSKNHPMLAEWGFQIKLHNCMYQRAFKSGLTAEVSPYLMWSIVKTLWRREPE